MNSSSQQERLEIRVSPYDKGLIKKAQQLSGDKTISGFVMRVLRQHAQQIIEENDKILLGDRDREVFFEAIFNDIEPNNLLKSAAANYRANFTEE